MKTAHRKAARAKRQHTVNPTAWFETILANRPPPVAHADQVVNTVRTAFEAMKCGTSDTKHFFRLASAMNVGLVRAESIDPLVEQAVQAGMDAVRRSDAIFTRHGRFGFSGPDLQVVADAVDTYEQILRLSTPAQMEAAVVESARRMLAQAEEVQS